MGDFHIPGQPFVIHLPDDWTITYYEPYGCYVAQPPLGSIIANYMIRPETTLYEAIPSFLYQFGSSAPYGNQINYSSLLTLNGMNAAIIKEIVSNAFVALLVEHLGVVLHVFTWGLYGVPPEYTDPILLVISGVFPGKAVVLEDQVQVPPIQEKDPTKLHAMLSKLKINEGAPFKKILHSGKKLAVKTPRTGDFGKLPITVQHHDKFAQYIKELQEISQVLKNDKKYADYGAELIKIYRILIDTLQPPDQ